MRIGSKHICGGGVLDHIHVLSASHCFIGFPTNIFRIYAGSPDIFKQNIIRNVKYVFKHEKFNEMSLRNDIAVLRVKLVT